MGTLSIISIQKYNRKLLKNGKRKPFTKMNGGSSNKKNYVPYVLPQVPPNVLRRVRLKTQRENKRLLVKKTIIGFIVLVVLLYVLYF